jgi:hypothetical protein
VEMQARIEHSVDEKNSGRFGHNSIPQECDLFDSLLITWRDLNLLVRREFARIGHIEACSVINRVDL